MRHNPLSPTPPPPKGKRHRTGDQHALKLRELFGHLDSGFDDIYRGVFVADIPLVAYAYAIARREVGENDFGLPDVVDPPVLIGLSIDPSEEHIDTDAMTAASNILSVAQLIRLKEYDEEESEEELRDYSRPEFFDFSEFGLGYAGGSVGNLPSASDLRLEVDKMIKLLEEADIDPGEEPTEFPDDLLRAALQAGARIIPQARLLREVTAKEVAQILVVPPISNPEEADEFETTEIPFDLLEENEIYRADAWLVSQSVPIYQRGKANRWHGTSLSIARKAFPEIVDGPTYHEGIRAGSAYDLDELEQDLNEEEEDEEE